MTATLSFRDACSRVWVPSTTEDSELLLVIFSNPILVRCQYTQRPQKSVTAEALGVCPSFIFLLWCLQTIRVPQWPEINATVVISKPTLDLAIMFSLGPTNDKPLPVFLVYVILVTFAVITTPRYVSNTVAKKKVLSLRLSAACQSVDQLSSCTR